MTKKRLRIPADLLAFLRTAHPDIRKKIRAGLKDIAVNPSGGKALKDDLEGLRSYRIGGYRVIYREGGSFLEIVAIGERNRIYEDTLRKLLREKEKPGK